MEDWKFKPARDLHLDSQARLGSINREPNFIEFCCSHIFRLLTKSYLNLFHSLKVYGSKNIPATLPYILVANHSSHLDALCLLSALPVSHYINFHPIAAADAFFKTRPSSIFSALTINALPLSRRSPTQAIEEIHSLRERMLSVACGYIIFPEGSRSRTGELNHFKRGIGILAAGTDIPIIPCHISGAYESLAPSSKLPKINPIRLRIGEARTYQTTPNDEKGWQQIAEELYHAVLKLSD